jgi:hypothetical protein
MNITDTVLSAELTTEHQIESQYLPEEIRETPLVWVTVVDTNSGETSYILQSRQYVEKMKPEYGWRPALGFYELLFLRTNSVEEFHWSRDFVRNYDELWENLVTNAMENYRSLVHNASEREAPSINRLRGITRNWTNGPTLEEDIYGTPDRVRSRE